jgi:hypothetical protein
MEIENQQEEEMDVIEIQEDPSNSDLQSNN